MPTSSYQNVMTFQEFMPVDRKTVYAVTRLLLKFLEKLLRNIPNDVRDRYHGTYRGARWPE